MLSSLKSHRVTLLIAVSILSMTGCHPAMSTHANTRIEPPAQTLAVPLRFKLHNFDVHCYNTLRCSVIYDNNDFARPYLNTPTEAPAVSDYQKHWGTASYLGIKNFPAPASVRWTSKDGEAHEATVDIGAIFKDELIWHNVSKLDMADFYAGPVAGDPDVFLAVNDHTVSVYMAMFIPTKTEKIPGNKDSNFRKDVILAWSHIY